MAEHAEHDAPSGQSTTGHEWDGVKELDTPLPRWWLYIFYATIVAAIVYWVLMPAWPIGNGFTPGVLHYSDRNNVAADVAQLQRSRAPLFRRLAAATPAQIQSDPELLQFARAAGESVFGDHCRTCHGAGGAGRPGYPSLADDVWLWGGSLSDIEHTIRVGVRSENPHTRASQMPAFGRDHIFTPQQVADATEYVISISGASSRLHPDVNAAARGALLYHDNCAVCHGPTGTGDRSVGAPSLRDDVWLYGGTRVEIRRQIEMGRGGVMPTWERMFDAGAIRALAVYVHEMGGGEPDARLGPIATTPAVPGSPANAATPAQTSVVLTPR